MGTIFEFVNNLKRKPFIQSIMNDLHGEAFLVGGATRDLLLGKQNKDVDLVIRLVNIDILLNQLRKFGSANIVGKSFGVITFKDNSDGEIYDVALPRTEFANGDGGHKGFDIIYDENLPIEKDLIRRDAKFNAIAINLNTNQIIDPHGGLDDIKNKQTSLVNPDAFTDDPLRLLRFVGFTSRNEGFKISPDSMAKIHQTAHRIKEISPERILKEFEKIVEKGSPESGAKLLVETTLYQNIFDTQFKGSFAQFAKVKTLAEFMFLLMNSSIANPAKFYIQHFGDYGSLSKIISAFELTRQEINTPAEERWLMNAVNKIDPKAVGSFVVQDKLKDASIHQEDRYPRKAADLAVTGGEIDAMGITGGQHGQLNTDLLNLIYGDKLENTRDAVMGYIQQNFDKYKSTPQKIREIAAKILKESEVPDVYDFQDSHAEKIIHTSWNGAGGNQWRYRFENAGDILRELGKYSNQFLDGNYIFEKVNKIESFINAFGNEHRLHYDDKYSTLKLLNADNLKALRHAYEIQPVVTEAQKVALQLIFNLIDGKLSEAKTQIEYFDQFRDDDGEVKLKMANRYPNQINNTPQLNESEGNLDGNFKALVQQVKQRVPSLAKYNEFPEDNYDHFQLSKRIGKADVYWHNQQLTLTNVAIMSEFKMSYRNFNQKKWYNFTLKNQIFFDIPDTYGTDMERFVMQTAFNMLNDKYSYHKELMVPETTTYQQADIDAIINEINRKTFEFEDHVNNFTRTEIFEQVKVNGRELSKSEELELLTRDAAEKRLIVKTGDYRDGANALHSLSIINSRIRMITLELKIEELSKIQDNERNAQRYDKFDKQIKKLRNELDQLKYPELLKEGYEMRGAWFIPDASGGGSVAETKNHSQYAAKYFGMRDQDAAFTRALKNGWVRIVYPFENTPWAFNSFNRENLVKALQKLRTEIIYGRSKNIYIDYKDDDWETYSVKDPEFLHKFGLLHEAKDIVEKLTRESLTLYHGSPHKFDKFSTEHMGTGEGAQAFGWGLYFTELQDIAQHYASINPDIFNADMAYITKYISGYNYSSVDIRRVSSMPIPERNNLINQAYEREIATIKRMCGGSDRMAQIVYKHSEAEEIKLETERRDKYLNISNIQQRNMYQVTVHKGKTPDQYTWLEWDRVVPPNMLAKIRSYISTSKESDYENVDSSYQIRQYMRVMDDPNYSPQTKTGEKLYRDLSSYLGEKGASMLLLRCGIDGVKYAAESISHGKTSDTARGFDYVVFDDKAVTLDTHKQLEEKKTKFTKQQLTEMVMEAQRSQLNRLVLFDMDSTLINSPMPEFGREEYKQKTGGDFPSEKAWWSVPESLDTNVFDITAIAPVFNQMRDEQRRSDTMVVVMTNRLDTLERQVKRVLRLNRINPDALNMASYAMQNKGERILQILKENPSIRYVAFYDDQEKNIMDVRNALRKKGITYDLYNCQDGKIRRT